MSWPLYRRVTVNKGSTVQITEEKQIFDVCKTETVKI